MSDDFPEIMEYNEDEFYGNLTKNGLPISEEKVTGGKWVETGYWTTVIVNGRCILWYYSPLGKRECMEWEKAYEDKWVPTGEEWVDTYTTYYTQNYKGKVYKHGVDKIYLYEIIIKYKSKP